MKRLLFAVAAIALMVPAAASAQRQDDRHKGNRPEHNQAQPAQQQHQQRAWQNEARSNQAVRTNNVARTREVVRSNVNDVSRERGKRANEPRGRRTWNGGANVYSIGHRPSSFRRIRTTTFQYPRGYHYRRFSIGSILPRLFLSSFYYWNDYGALGLGAPPPGYVWVRYGPDLLLVNRYNGRIADVIYGAFY